MDTSLFWKPKPLILPANYEVQGYSATSLEYYIAVALNKYNLDFEFQVSLNGGWFKPGGQVLDFLVHTKPLPTPLEANGNYWHRDPSYELFQSAQIKMILGPMYADLIIIWGEEADTQDKAFQAVRKAFIL